MLHLQPYDSSRLDTLIDIWNAACGPALPATRRFVEFNTSPPPGAEQAGCLAMSAGQPVGFALASAAVELFGHTGWIDALAVIPTARRQGVGGALLSWAERWLAEHGCTTARLGGSLRPFAPGLPVELGSQAFFARQGYLPQRQVWDVARRLNDYVDHNGLPLDIRPLQSGETPALRAFMEQAFPGRWAYECREALTGDGRPGDYLALWVGDMVAGFCRLTFEDSPAPIERFYPQRLPRPWGQLGPIGVGPEYRGQGYGAALLAAGLGHLRDRGVDGCVIDWTDLLEFYARFGFEPYRQYAVLTKRM
jgi:GNAT superfamily N-acetyltransferase